MTVMLTNNSGIRVGWLAGKYPGKIGHLYSPGGQRGPYEFMPFGLDNGAFGAFVRKRLWDPEPWMQLLDWVKLRGAIPQWVIVPDVVGDRCGTIASWQEWSPVARRYGWPLAFAVQDGMDHQDVPSNAEVIFVGGTTNWKWSTIGLWASRFPRVHVGRVNTYRRLIQCDRLGIESVDGTGWMRGDQRQWRGLLAYLTKAGYSQDAFNWQEECA